MEIMNDNARIPQLSMEKNQVSQTFNPNLSYSPHKYKYLKFLFTNPELNRLFARLEIDKRKI